MWHFYRHDFESSSGQDGQTATNAWRWDFGKEAWVSIVPASSPVDTTDVVGNIFIQIDNASTDLGANLSANSDINIAAAAVPFASTGTFGGRFDNGTSSYFYTESTFVNGTRRSIALTNAPPSFRITFDNNTTKAGYCSVFTSFKTLQLS